MIVICEECGKKYRVEIDKIKGKKASFRCVTCNHVTVFSKPEAEASEESYSPPQQPAREPFSAEFNHEISSGPETEPEMPAEQEQRRPTSNRKIGIRGKMLMIVMVIPMIMIFLSVLPSYNYISKAVNLIVEEAGESEIEVAKNQINQSASTIAKQIEFYLMNHPEITPETAGKDEKLQEILFQHALMVDDASLYLRFDPKNSGVFLINRDETLIGKEVKSIMIKGILENARYDEFGKVIPAGPAGEYREAMGFFLARDENGNLKEKILALAPVPQTPYGVIVTADTEDFMLPVKLLEKRIRDLISGARNIIAGVLGGIMILIVSLILYYVSNITGKIKTLTEAANRISVGELETHIEVRSKDEIGELADAISRMQDSIRLSIARLRKRY